MKAALIYIPISYMFLAFLPTSITWADSVRSIPHLSSITFWERTEGSAPSAFTFEISSSELTMRLSDPLSSSNSDFGGVPGKEFYDVYYSNADGAYNLDGEFLTISGTYSNPLPAGGGLNLAEIGLNFTSSTTEYGNYVASFIALGDNAIPSSVDEAIDGDLLTHTTMGNTVGQSDRLRVTLGFLSSSGPAPIPLPPAFFLLLSGLTVVGVASRNRTASNC